MQQEEVKELDEEEQDLARVQPRDQRCQAPDLTIMDSQLQDGINQLNTAGEVAPARSQHSDVHGTSLPSSTW